MTHLPVTDRTSKMADTPGLVKGTEHCKIMPHIGLLHSRLHQYIIIIYVVSLKPQFIAHIISF